MKSGRKFVVAVIILLTSQSIAQENDRLSIIDDGANASSNSKSFGIELSPISLITMKEEAVDIYGAFSMFGIDPKAEFAFPFSYHSRKESDWYDFEATFQSFSIDGQYRRFLNGVQNGLFFSVGCRYTYEKGVDMEQSWYVSEGDYFTRHKLGIGFGIGYRLFTKSNFYWGVNLFGGRYFTGDDIDIDDLSGASLDQSLFISLELLKFGYSF